LTELSGWDLRRDRSSSLAHSAICQLLHLLSGAYQIVQRFLKIVLVPVVLVLLACVLLQFRNDTEILVWLLTMCSTGLQVHIDSHICSRWLQLSRWGHVCVILFILISVPSGQLIPQGSTQLAAGVDAGVDMLQFLIHWICAPW
jgi:hypothetical protein